MHHPYNMNRGTHASWLQLYTWRRPWSLAMYALGFVFPNKKIGFDRFFLYFKIESSHRNPPYRPPTGASRTAGHACHLTHTGADRHCGLGVIPLAPVVHARLRRRKAQAHVWGFVRPTGGACRSPVTACQNSLTLDRYVDCNVLATMLGGFMMRWSSYVRDKSTVQCEEVRSRSHPQ